MIRFYNESILSSFFKVQKFDIIKSGDRGEVHYYKVILSKALEGEALIGKAMIKHLKLEVTVHSSLLLYDAKGCLKYYPSPIEGIFYLFVSILRS